MYCDAEFEPPPPAKPTVVPWALLLALALVLCFEAWVRTWPAEKRIAYRDEGDQAIAVRNQALAGPLPEVAFVGSSMTYQGVSTGDLERRLTSELDRPVTVGNFAIRGGRIDVTEAMVRTLLRQQAAPKMIVVGIGMRDLREHYLDLDRMSELWTFADWRRESADGWLANQLPQVLRNEAGRAWMTLRCRTAIALAAEQCFLDLPAEPMPARGQRPSQHEGGRRGVTLADSLAAFSKPTNKRRMIQAYRPDLRARPPTILSDRVGAIIDDCRRAGAKVMFVDMPLSQPLRDLIDSAQKKSDARDASKDFDPEYRKIVSKWAKKGGVPFVQADRMRVMWTNDDFFDGQHLNYWGAMRMSNALAPMIAAEMQK